MLGLAGFSLVLGPSACTPTERATTGAPPVTYTGPEVLRGSVRSLTRIRHYEPLLVSGYGIVVGLDGTGSSEIPSFLEQHMTNYARQMGVGDATLEQQMPEEYRRFTRMSPRELLQRQDTAIVAVEGLVPPGAVQGSQFDVVVSALEQTQTTSLAGGVLWSTPLSVGGLDPGMRFSHIVANAHGPIYIDPLAEDDGGDAFERDATDHLRQATVVSGGHTTERRRIELILNQPSWQRSRDIADRINERFPTAPGESIQTANPQSPQVIRLNIPRAYADRPTELIDLIAHLYIQRGPGFEPRQARELAEALREEPEDEEFAEAVVLAWRALGRTIIPTLREFYEDEQMNLRLAALHAGAALEDERTTRHLAPLVEHEDAQVRIRTAEALVELPDSRRGRAALRQLLDDSEPEVRIAAYESAAVINDGGLVDRFGIQGPQGYKFVIDRIAAERPMVYVTHEHMPRIAIFGPEMNLGFDMPMLARLWNNRLMLHSEDEHALKLYYQPPREVQGESHELAPSVANLAYVLGQHPGPDHPTGLDLSFSQVVYVIHQLCERGDIDAAFEFASSPMAEMVQRHREDELDERRPEVGAPYAPEEAEQEEDDETVAAEERAARGPDRPDTP